MLCDEFPTVYCKVYGHKLMTLSSQTLLYISKCMIMAVCCFKDAFFCSDLPLFSHSFLFFKLVYFEHSYELIKKIHFIFDDMRELLGH